MLRITGGKGYDPANGINGEVRDICIADGKVVADVEGGRTIDATGMIVFPGGVDIHTHVAGAALNFARALTPENQRVAAKFLHTKETRMGIGGQTPTTFATGYLYAGMGYTTAIEAAVPVLSVLRVKIAAVYIPRRSSVAVRRDRHVAFHQSPPRPVRSFGFLSPKRHPLLRLSAALQRGQ